LNEPRDGQLRLDHNVVSRQQEVGGVVVGIRHPAVDPAAVFGELELQRMSGPVALPPCPPFIRRLSFAFGDPRLQSIDLLKAIFKL
jgi:hypothetical protein